MGTLGFLWSFTRASVTGALFGVTISDRYASIVPVRGLSMYPTFCPGWNSFPRSFVGEHFHPFTKWVTYGDNRFCVEWILTGCLKSLKGHPCPMCQ